MINKFDLNRMARASYCFIRRNDKNTHNIAIKDCVDYTAVLGLLVFIGLAIVGTSLFGGFSISSIGLSNGLFAIGSVFAILWITKQVIKRRINLKDFDTFYKNENPETIKKERTYYTTWYAIFALFFGLMLLIATFL